MTARLRKLIDDIQDAFWLVPGLLVVLGAGGALGMLMLDRMSTASTASQSIWSYGGGATGARALLGAIASSTITVAGTVFSITVAALTLAAGQMGPRLLRNFTRDRGNQLVLGAYLGTFVYALLVLRSVRSEEEGDFVPHLAVTAGIGLAVLCVFALVWFVDHMASRINVDTVISLVSEDLQNTICHLASDEAQPGPPLRDVWRGAEPVLDTRQGYLQQIDAEAIADWAAEKGTAVRLLVRPGDFVFPNAPIALTVHPVDGAAAAIAGASALNHQRSSSADLEQSVRQLVELALRALSPGINDPFTAISVIDHLGAALCVLVPLHLPTGVVERGGKVVTVVPGIDYDGLVDAMLHAIRQNAAGNPPVLIRMLEMLAAVGSAERQPGRRRTLQRHAALVLADAERSIEAPADLADVRRRYDLLLAVTDGPDADVGALVG
ncbi:MAG: DUF2254 domain-containing protein [Hyphomicrobiaceae bacterium]